jgi:hypothetical protein
MSFRLFAAVRYPSPSLSDSASSPTAAVSSAFFRLPTFADLTGVMSLEMSLASGVLQICSSKCLKQSDEGVC